ncbi:hypothetical protein NE237_030484 [Protea cynaroides]|uniref:RNase III domain-containing protein n=1 Tax=Protea cynaroides TaxID=273540 RepID=A0A9Q0GXB7_9MAGN|nr:hypothetical protein NE237_030484 [Protea cynaroides]
MAMEAVDTNMKSAAEAVKSLEFFGDAALGLAFTECIFRNYPELDLGQLSLVHAANVCTENFARVAVRHQLINAPFLQDKVFKLLVEPIITPEKLRRSHSR